MHRSEALPAEAGDHAESGSDARALLVTDIVDSTRLTEVLGNAEAARLWAAHDRLARDLLPRWRGREIDKSDGLLLLFDDAVEAAGYAAAYHRGLQALPVPVQARAGLHVGPVILRENPAADVALGAKPVEVEGIAKAMAARIMALAHPGQTLLSEQAARALDGSAWSLRAHGHWRLKGVADPVALFEAGAPGAAGPTPADHPKAYRVVRDGDLWLPVREVPRSLPAERDAFIGRQATLAELARRFQRGARLVNLTGFGGTGKTRVATRFAWECLGDFPGGAWFCDLSQARSLDGIVAAVGQALDVPLGEGDAVAQLGSAIAARRACLVILDNFEQVAEHAEATLGQWLDRAADARFLVTSRGVLGIPGESVLPLAPLPPADGAALFTQRARDARRGFEPSGEDREAIVPLIRLLDGLPLAIELAAARVRVMPPRVLLSRMSERFKLLTATAGRHDRQSTLRATFDWSWELLSRAEKAALAQLCVFEGGFALEAAEAVVDLSSLDDAVWTVDALQSLVEKSFVRQVSDERFDLLASVQDYARERLRAPDAYPGSGPAAALSAEVRHGAYFAGFDDRRATAQRCIELDNLMRACRRAVARGDAGVATRTLEAAWACLQRRGPFRAGLDLATAVAAMPGLPPACSVRVELVAGRALQSMGRAAEARDRCTTALERARGLGDRPCEGRLRSHLGTLAVHESNMDEARAHFTAAVTIARETADAALECEALNGLGAFDQALGRLDDARRHYEAALAVARASADRSWEGGLLGNLGYLDASQGRMSEARDRFESALDCSRELGDRKWEGNALSNLGLLHQLAGELPEARAQLEEALTVARQIGHAQLEAVVLCNLGLVNEAMGRIDDACVNQEAALAVARELRDRRLEGQVLGYLGLLRARQGRFDASRADFVAGAALLREASDELSLGVLLCGRTELEWLAGAATAAEAALREAEATARAVDAAPGSELATALERVRVLLRAAGDA
jgi:predicted ATPase/class 3 adenylate cyclase/Tfp pilus assembly protein PilF